MSTVHLLRDRERERETERSMGRREYKSVAVVLGACDSIAEERALTRQRVPLHHTCTKPQGVDLVRCMHCGGERSFRGERRWECRIVSRILSSASMNREKVKGGV